ncbi:MAG: HAD-IA family hydrolase [Betaproteobacteria bacterium]
MIVTFDLFSAMTNSRSGGSNTFGKLAMSHGWDIKGELLYDCWDAHNKAGQRTATPPASFHDLSLQALNQAYIDLGLSTSTIEADMTTLEESVANWPLWPDIASAVHKIAEYARVGILSNVDNRLARRTQGFGLIDPELALTSQRLGAYKPNPAIYHAAIATVAPEKLVHVAASARDVRGALEAGITVVRLARPGHTLDPEGPKPHLEVEDAADLVHLLTRL